MANIFPFCGLRYNKQKVKGINKVFAPPYDVILEPEQDRLYAQHPQNIVRLILGKVYRQDNDKDNRYHRALGFLKKWIKDEILVFDPKPCLYIYAQDYTIEGVKKTRIGFIARMQLDGKGNRCLPHEHTLVKPKEDRLKLIRAVEANLSPIFSFYLDNKDTISKTLKRYTAKKALIDFKDKEKIRHRFWKVDDIGAIRNIRQLMKKKQIFIADGHHRYEVSLAYRAEMMNKLHTKTGDFNYMMMYFTGFSEQNLSVLPTHRLVRPMPDLRAKIKKVEKYFKKVKLKNLDTLLSAQKKTAGFSLGLYYKRAFYLLEIKNRALLSRLMRKSPLGWRKLDVAMLNKIVFEHVFGLKEADKEEKIGYTRDPKFALACVKKGYFEAAFFLKATKPQQVKKIALSRNRMPQKSTYFYPKPITGLVINKFLT